MRRSLVAVLCSFSPWFSWLKNAKPNSADLTSITNYSNVCKIGIVWIRGNKAAVTLKVVRLPKMDSCENNVAIRTAYNDTFQLDTLITSSFNGIRQWEGLSARSVVEQVENQFGGVDGVEED